MYAKSIGFRHPQYSQAPDYAGIRHIPALNEVLDTYTRQARQTPQPDWHLKNAILYFTYGEQGYALGPDSLHTTPEIFGLLAGAIMKALQAHDACDLAYYSTLA